MRIKPSESAQRSLIKAYWKEGRAVLYKTSLPVLNLADNVTPAELKNRVDQLLDPEPMYKYISKLWTKVGGKFANDMASMVLKRKGLEDPNIDEWEEGFKIYTNERSRQITKKILKTQEQYIKSVIDRVVSEAQTTGEAISAISGKIKEAFEQELVLMQKYEAERIARTEVIGASNKGSFDGAKSTGIPMQKIWSTSGLPGIRDTHLFYESRGWLGMDDEFGPGLQYPGDPDGQPEEIINCRCSILYNVD